MKSSKSRHHRPEHKARPAPPLARAAEQTGDVDVLGNMGWPKFSHLYPYERVERTRRKNE